MTTTTESTVCLLPDLATDHARYFVTVEWEYTTNNYIVTVPTSVTPSFYNMLAVINGAIPRDEGAHVVDVYQLV